MLQRSVPATSALPGRPVRILLETNDPSVFAGATRHLPGVDVAVCSGPTTDAEMCPLVADGTCPLGVHDVVVSDLRGPWAQPVRDAWLRTDAVVTAPRPGDLDRSSAPTDQLDAYLGAALTALYRAHYANRAVREQSGGRGGT